MNKESQETTSQGEAGRELARLICCRGTLNVYLLSSLLLSGIFRPSLGTVDLSTSVQLYSNLVASAWRLNRSLDISRDASE